MTSGTDKFGRKTLYNYATASGVVQLRTVVDPDGRTNSLSYSNAFPNLLRSISDPYGRTASFLYTTNAQLGRIIDGIGLTNDFAYDSSGFITNLFTPYGATVFKYNFPTGYQNTNDYGVLRFVEAMEPPGDSQLFFYRVDSTYLNYTASGTNISFISGGYFNNAGLNLDLSVLPTRESGLDNYRNSFHWGRQQYAKVMAQNSAYNTSRNFNDLTLSDYKLAQINHWAAHAGESGTLLESSKFDSILRFDTLPLCTEPGTSSLRPAAENGPSYHLPANL